MLKLNFDNANGKWYTYDNDEDIKFHIIPFPYTKMILDIYSSGNDSNLGVESQLRFMFIKCITAWEGFINNVTGELLECNDINKGIIFDNFHEIVIFVTNIINSTENKLEVELKN